MCIADSLVRSPDKAVRGTSWLLDYNLKEHYSAWNSFCPRNTRKDTKEEFFFDVLRVVRIFCERFLGRAFYHPYLRSLFFVSFVCFVGWVVTNTNTFFQRDFWHNRSYQVTVSEFLLTYNSCSYLNKGTVQNLCQHNLSQEDTQANFKMTIDNDSMLWECEYWQVF